MKKHPIWKLNTSNPGKFEEFKRLFAGHGYTLEVTHHDLDEIQAEPIEVIVHKASQMDEYVLVEDTSLVVEGADIGINIRWLIDRLPEYTGRKASWKVFLAYRKGESIYIYEGVVKGCIVSPRGKQGFGFDSVFIPEGAEKTLAEDKPDHNNARAFAVQALIDDKIYKVLPMMNEWTGPWQS
jgi:XTP/dITP diphosphohydrolase